MRVPSEETVSCAPEFPDATNACRKFQDRPEFVENTTVPSIAPHATVDASALQSHHEMPAKPAAAVYTVDHVEAVSVLLRIVPPIA